MKIVCDACQAKYSISDDKVQGKVFKIRCKKCSNIIVVRGGAAAAEPAPAPTQEKDTRVYDYGYEGGDQPPAADDAVWHVVINQDQVGPMTAQDVERRFAAGEIDAETYAWREGFADWMPLAQVDAFAALVASGRTTTAAGGGGAAAVAAMFGGGDEAGTVRSDPGDLFAAASASARGVDDDGDLFGSKPAVSAAAAAPQAKLRGERNENSVLFSLNNLAQLASNKPAPAAAAPAATTMPGHASGAAGGEGSGLIDIRSMASAYLGGGAAAKPATSSAVGSIDDLPVFGGGGFSEPAVIVPTVRSQSNNKLLYALIGSVGLLAIAAVILVVVLVTGGKKDDDNKLAAAATDVDKDKGKGKDKQDEEPKQDEAAAKTEDPKRDEAAAKTEDPKRDEAAAKTEPPKQDEPKADDKKPAPAPKRDTRPAVASNTPRPAKTVTRTEPKSEPKSTDSGGCDEVSCVLNNYEGACCAKFRKGGSKPSSSSAPRTAGDVPASLDRAMISAGIAPVKGRAMACGDRSSKKGIVKVSVKVSPDGSVASVTVKESPDPALSSCVASVMKTARFARTASGGSFGYPFPF